MAFKPYYKNNSGNLVELQLYADRAEKDGSGNNIAQTYGRVGANTENSPTAPESLQVGGLYFELDVPKKLSGTVVTTSRNTTVTLRQPGERDWGDGTIDSSTSHVYANGGTYKFVYTSAEIDTINANAFYGNTYLKSITIPDKIKTIGNSAFANTSRLEEVNYYAVEANDRTSNNQIFCYAGQSGNGIVLNIGKKVKKIPAYLFYPLGNTYAMPYFTKVIFEPKSQCTSIGNYAFEENRMLTCINLPDNLTSIGKSSFENCSGLYEMTIPKNVTSIGDRAFIGTQIREIYNLSQLVITAGSPTSENGYIGATAYIVHNSIGESSRIIKENGSVYYVYETDYKLIGFTDRLCTSVSINSSVKEIAPGATYWLARLASITIPGNIKSVPAGTVDSCKALTSVIIENGVETIGRQAFRDNNIIAATIPASVTSITGNPFTGNPITEISVDSGNTYYDSRENCNGVIEKATKKLIVGTKNTIIPSSVKTIGYQAFVGNSALTTISIPNTVTTIESSAFSTCQYLKSISIPSSVTSIGDYAFVYCFALASAKILSTQISTLDSSVFTSCSKLLDLKVAWSSGAVANAPWGATNATITYDYSE